MTPSPLFTTERLSVRPWTANDLEPAWSIYGDPEVMRYVGAGIPYPSRLETLAWLRRREDETRASTGSGCWAVTERETGVIVGTTLLMPFAETAQIEVGYHFRRSAWGQGYATEVARATIRHAFDALGLPRIVAVAYPENIASQRVLKKVGMRRDGFFDYRGVRAAYFVREAEPASQPER